MNIRRLSPSDADKYNEFFAEGTRRFPTTLRIHELDIQQSPFSIATHDGSCTLLAYEEERWLGVGTVERELGRVKRNHIAWVVRMLVVEGNRGVGRAILKELKTIAKQWSGIEKLNLTVAAHNTGAIHLYESEGFAVFSKEKDAFRVNEQAIDELSMSLVL